MKKQISTKKLILPAVFILFLVGLSSCGKGSNPFAPNNPVNPSVSFTMGSTAGPNNGTQFTFRPSVDVKVTRLVVSTQGFADTISDNSGQTYSAGNDWVYPNEYITNSGETWSFSFTGSIASNNQAFNNVSASYNIP